MCMFQKWTHFFFKYMARFRERDSTIDAKRTRGGHVPSNAKNSTKLVRVLINTKKIFGSISQKISPVELQHWFQLNCCICAHIRRLWFKKSMTKLVKQDWILQNNTSMLHMTQTKPHEEIWFSFQLIHEI
jgi:hypothetical protein